MVLFIHYNLLLTPLFSIAALTKSTCLAPFRMSNTLCISFFPHGGLRSHKNVGPFCKNNGGEIGEDSSDAKFSAGRYDAYVPFHTNKYMSCLFLYLGTNH